MRRKWALWIIVGIIAAIFIAALSMALSAKFAQDKIKKTSDTFVADVLGGDVNGSYGLQTPNAQQLIPKSDWSGTVDKVSTFFKGQSATLQSKTFSSDYAFFTYKITGSDGDYLFKVSLTPSGKVWLVQSFKSELQVN